MTKITIATHCGIFHPDDVFAVAVLKIYLEGKGKQVEIIRTRDEEIINKSDYVVDVGEIYDAAKNRFDHHKKDLAGKRDNGILYASFGLVWKHFGDKLVSNSEVWEAIDRKIVMPIDALDNAMNLSTPNYSGVREYSVYHVLSALSNPTGNVKPDDQFKKALEIAQLILLGEIKKLESKIESEKLVTAVILKQGEPDLLILEKYINWEVAVSKYKNIKLVIFPDGFADKWCLQVARDNPEIFANDRINFPEPWRGLSGNELIKVSGLAGSLFCHASGYYATAKTKDDAIQMANRVIYLTS